MRRTKPAGVVAAAGVAVAVLLGTLAGCGEDAEDDRSAYCAEVVAQQRPLAESFAEGATTGLIASLPSFEKLRDKAPDDIADDWAVVIRRTEVLQQAIEDAGADPSTYDATDPPDDVSRADQVAIKAAANGLLTDATQAAFQAVQQQARDVCREPLSLQ